MRAIDADKLMVALDKGTPVYIGDESYMNEGFLVQTISDQPTLTVDDMRENSRWYQNEKGEVRCDDCDWLAATGGPEALAEAVEEHRYCGGCGARMVGEITTEVVMW